MNRTTVFIDAWLVLRDRVSRGWLLIDGPTIVGCGTGVPPEAATTVPLDGDYLMPGLIDIHCHGAAGAVVYDGEAALRTVAAAHLAHGTTSLIASIPTVDRSVMITATRLIARLLREVPDPPLNLAGVHWEGPFLSKDRPGAQTVQAIIDPSAELVESLLSTAGRIPAMMTIAPELVGATDLIRTYADRLRFAIGHTDADHRRTVAAIDAGARHVTHLFNAMPGLGHRDPGPVAAALTDGRVGYELIADGQHVADPVLALAAGVDHARRAVLITDASAAAGLADGRYRIADRELDVRHGAVRRVGSDRLAGSAVFLIDCVRHLVDSVKIPIADAVAMATVNPATRIGLERRGELRPGRRADLLVVDDALQVRSIFTAGVRHQQSSEMILSGPSGHQPEESS
ncbi:N-acetylglucosamine-6-phosphate deacetylase [Microlunatus soli]|uniref:N-acetylglucosamine 6-phosphate deacetylase n=1 Tax=Microlunatus soli TaxID=630515 RepID=A0A1H1RWW1_9ACTN|nr:N-acetylglucosamine-6-phosphate deacetylase [Microlunatus soli]SDS40222.1 N-acetylglucosamine 6-phosphate deacetylase [Microlunatus soli]